MASGLSTLSPPAHDVLLTVLLCATDCCRMLVTVVLALAMAAMPQQTVRGQKAALLIIDVQDCFLPGGSLPVTDSEQVVPVINQLRADHEDKFSLVVVSQDWHCPDHVSFASQHPGKSLFSTVNLTYNALKGTLCYGDNVPKDFPHAVDCSGVVASDRVVVPQTLWPDHCVIDVTTGPTSAEFSSSLIVKDSDVVIRKGDSCGVDSYSAFFDNGGFHKTRLDSVMREQGIELVVVTGLALDYCAYYTAKDAHALGYRVLTVTDACRGVYPDSTAAALADLRATGVELIEAWDLEGALQDRVRVGQPGGLSLVLLLVAGALVTAYLIRRTKPSSSSKE
ncbi:hypothetical protein ACOMHN_043547 [Nucella lapillus]